MPPTLVPLEGEHLDQAVQVLRAILLPYYRDRAPRPARQDPPGGQPHHSLTPRPEDVETP
jgi:hypothetical protein